MSPLHQVLKSSRAAIDLASIMVGVIIIGIIGGIIGATVFAVIPWTQDKAAKQQLESIHTAENAFFGLNSDANAVLKNTTVRSTFADSTQLSANDLLTEGQTYCVTKINSGKGYNAYVRSASGKVFAASNVDQQATVYTGTSCLDGTDSGAPQTPVTATLTQFTINCPAGVTTAGLPFAGTISGTATWSDGVKSTSLQRTVTPETEYTVVFDGTFTDLLSRGILTSAQRSCVRSMDYWGNDSKTWNASYGLSEMVNLTSAPTQIPSSVTNLRNMFLYDRNFNSSNVSTWNVSKVTDFSEMFSRASIFNQDISNWDTSSAKDMHSMFDNALAFNQSLNKWNVSGVIDMSQMFFAASKFNQNLASWDTSKVMNMQSMFGFATVFNQNISGWNVTNVTNYTTFKDRSALTNANTPTKFLA
jgi:surface protein